MKRNKNDRKLALSTSTVRRLAEANLDGVVGGYNTQTICPTVMQTHCYTCRHCNTNDFTLDC
jgi:hypothetical protein